MAARDHEEDEADPLGAHQEGLSFLAELGIALTAAGDATTLIHDGLLRAAAAYGYKDVRILVLPTFLILQSSRGRTAIVDITRRLQNDLRLDQIAAIFDLEDDVEAGRVGVREGRQRLRDIQRSVSRFPASAVWLGHGIVAGGVALLLQPSLLELCMSVLLGVMTGFLKTVTSHSPSLDRLRPVICSLLVSMIVFFAIQKGMDVRAGNLFIASVVTLLPGALLTTALIDLTAGDIIAGTSRLVSGMASVFLLVFGAIVAALLVDLPADISPQINELAWWTPYLGVVVFTLGVYIHLSAPRGSFPWLLVVAFAAWLAQAAGGAVLGSYLGAFFGALVIGPLAAFVRNRPGAPSPYVTFLPAFWLLVPGSLALTGLTELATDSAETGIADLVAMLLTLTSIALGILIGLDLVRSYRGVFDKSSPAHWEHLPGAHRFLRR